MNKNPLVIINNEKFFSEGGDFYCDNLVMKELPEGLSNFHQIQLVVRKAKKKRRQ